MSIKKTFNHSHNWLRLMAVFAFLVIVGTQASSLTRVHAATNTLTLNVISARSEPRAFGGAGVVKGVSIPHFKYIINIDNTGTTAQRSPADGCSPGSAGYPDSCKWVSIAGAASNAPIYTQGDQDDFANGGINLPDGRYLISVMAEGYRLDGVHFSVPLADPGRITVQLQPFPLPDATIRAFVFEDISPTNGAPDAPVEQGLAGFVGHIADYIGEVTTDIYGNPLCTRYQGEDPDTFAIPASALDDEMLPIPIPGSGGQCVSDETGMLAIPHLGPNRYALSAVAPDGTNWIQTTTLEGNHDWDAWVMEGSTGYDTEFVVAGEPFPIAIFGFVSERTPNLGGSNTIKGVVDAVKIYVPTVGGVSLPGEIWGGMAGGKIDKPIDSPWIALSDLGNGDTARYIFQGNADGSFTIPNVPDGTYTLTWWDEPQDYILNLTNVTVANGEVVDLGILPLNGWWTTLEGYVFNDTNRNGIKDSGEEGLDNYTVVMRKRENSVMDRGAVLVTTGPNLETGEHGYYFMENLYPMTQWLVVEAYSDLFYTTGVTYQADNQSEPTTILGAGVDVSILPIIGLGGRLDWGVHAYDPTGTNGIDPRNGGIAGTVSYDTTRNEIDPRFAAVEDWQPGISDLTVNLYTTVDCPVNGSAPCDESGRYQLDMDGSILKGQLINSTLTETWQRPGLNEDGYCVPRDLDGFELTFPDVIKSNTDCLEGPLMGVQFQMGYSTVDGNYGFGDGCFEPNVFDPDAGTCTIPDTEITDAFEPLPAADYLVEVAVPDDATGRPLYQVTKEEDINIANGDQFVPQIPPPACAGPLHTVDVAGIGTDEYPAVDLFGDGSVIVPASTPVENVTFETALNGSYYEGQLKPLCSTKLVTVSNGRSVAPTFNFFTDVPLPGRFWGLIVDDLNFSSNPKSLLYGEKAGVPFAPVGIYDFSNRLVTTVESDYNGLWDVLLPSTNRINCPTPSGVCAGMYRTVGNDPGVPGRLNPNYKPQFRTISADFEAYAGLIVPADLAPTQVGMTIQLPGGQFNQVSCPVNPGTPELFAVSKPYVNNSGNASNRTFTIQGQGFGATQGSGRVTLDGISVTVNSWSDVLLDVTVPSGNGGVSAGPHQLMITANNGQSTINGLTIHVIQSGNNGYNPNIYEVGPGRTYTTIQAAIDVAEASNGNDLVVVYPGTPNGVRNPRGAYYENLIITSPIKLQGVGPGGIISATNTTVPGSIIDGSAFGGDTALADAWRAKIAGLTWVGNQPAELSEGEVILLLATPTNPYGSSFKAAIDGFDIRGGDQQGQANIITQGGAIYAHAFVRNLQVTNNVIEGNSGSYGTVRIGTPDLPEPDTSQHNENLRIAHNRIIHNAGTNLAGGIALFAGSDNYEVAFNDLCGNFSAEYGGGISHYGYSPNGKIHDNRVYFNESYDEGGGIMIAGELPANPFVLSPGSGPVDIFNNLIQANMANDDGGGLRFLMAGNFPMNVYNNMIVNNVSTHEGGGISLNDAPNVRVYNNTIAKNITTATALTSLGFPAPAGLSTSVNSDLLQASLTGGAPHFSDPLLFNNLFWDNRAGTRSGGTVIGLSDGDANVWDLGVADGPYVLSVDASNLVGVNPLFVSEYNTDVTFAAWRNNPAFIGAIMVVTDLPTSLPGNYHLCWLGNSSCTVESPAIDAGVASKSGINAPAFDIDNQKRPGGLAFDIGADEKPTIADLAITKTDGLGSVSVGSPVTYTIVVTNNGPSAVSGVSVTDSFPITLNGVSWSCTASAGSSCVPGNSGYGSGDINANKVTLSLLNGGTATFVATGTLDFTATGILSNTATATSGDVDPDLSNNSATDMTSITVPVIPNVNLLDAFTRNGTQSNLSANAPSGVSWSQPNNNIRVNNNQAQENNGSIGFAYWNGTLGGGPTFGAKQAAAFSIANSTIASSSTGDSLILKATGGTATAPQNYIRVRLTSTSTVIVETTTNGGTSFANAGTLNNANSTFANGDVLTALVDSTGRVSVWRTRAGTTGFVGYVQLTNTLWTIGGGRIGMSLPNGARVDNFSGGNIP